ncbi:MAG TPA: YhcH/YjgK/YiaL family protein [Clostridiales bacterium]|nr:YhcH/YjgK/YiaL family protein [Clostridiales bacterium]HOL91199.1 YhcH/YjgK/YiaL family protein [Clostridiales bacterium]HPP34698.1 YhcH/YjgK/YiaL family protein [Clostridiales bacterium]
MIVDKLKNADLYYCLGEKMKKAFIYLQENDLSRLDEGRHSIDGEDLYILVMRYDSKPVDQGKWEAHRKYIDIQYIVDGKEKMGYANIEEMKIVQEYDESNDILFADGKGSFIDTDKGTFVVFTPNDAHMPGVMDNIPQKVSKVVVKVRI